MKKMKTRTVELREDQHVLDTQVRYQCPECETILEEGERRCEDCRKFGRKVIVLIVCPHCDTPISEEDLP